MNLPPGERSGRGPWRALRRAPLTLLAVIAAGIALAYGLESLRVRRAAQGALPRTTGEIHAPGLSAQVVIVRDARGIPHVEASSEADALFGLGFAQVQDRVGQMLWLRASARGRAAELVGKRALPADREARTLGIGRLADAQARRLDAPTRQALEAYSAGVNAGLSSLRSGEEPMPLALRGLEDALEPWSPADCIAIVKLEAWALENAMPASLLLADIIEALGGFAARPYFPEVPGRGRAVPDPMPGVAAAARPTQSRVDFPLRGATGLAARDAGSSALAVGARVSASGRPLVAGDGHAMPTVPARFYEAHLRGGGLDAAGATLPGAPVLWSGHNRHVAWASSFEPAVVTDLYVESLAPDGSPRFHDGHAFVPLSERTETLAVRGGANQELRVRATRHGPLVNDLVGGDRPPLSVAWTGALPGDGVTGLLRAAHAVNAAEFRAALRAHAEPVLAFAYGDTQGEAGIQLAGLLPRRRLETGLVPVPGRTEDYDWAGSLPFDLLPAATVEGTRSILVAADGRLLPASTSDDIEWLWRPGERQARLEEILGDGARAGGLDVQQLAALQLDVGSPRARTVIANALVLAGDRTALGKEDREVAEALSRWDGEVSAESVGAAVYQIFLQRVVHEVIVDRLGEDLGRRYLALPQASPVTLVERWLATAAAMAPESGDALRDALAKSVRASLRETWLWLNVRVGPNRERWAWGRMHPLRFRPIGVFPASEASADRGLGPFPFGGDGVTVAPGGYALDAPFDVTLASTHRFAIDAAQLDQAVTALVPGQSEHPGSPHLADAVPDWLAGRARLLLTSRLLIEETMQSRLVLTP